MVSPSASKQSPNVIAPKVSIAASTASLSAESLQSVTPTFGYSYDLDEDGVKDDPGELFGFRQNGAVIESGTGVDCAGGGSWEAISDTAISIQANGFYFKIDPDDSVNYEIEEGGVNEAGCGAGDVCLARRKIIVAMDAVLSSDNTVTASLRDEVKLKNDRYYTEP